jgi:hypothetical protein
MERLGKRQEDCHVTGSKGEVFWIGSKGMIWRRDDLLILRLGLAKTGASGKANISSLI